MTYFLVCLNTQTDHQCNVGLLKFTFMQLFHYKLHGELNKDEIYCGSSYTL